MLQRQALKNVAKHQTSMTAAGLVSKIHAHHSSDSEKLFLAARIRYRALSPEMVHG